MRLHKRLIVLAAVGMMFLGAGAADASPATYRVSKTWLETYVNGTPAIKPHIEDDVVEVTCRGGDQMTRWKINNPALDGGAFPRVDGTGIQIEPEWTGKTEVLTVTVFCRRS